MPSLSFSMPPREMSTELRTQLSQFGLNPQEWVLRPLAGDAYCAIHREDTELVLVGRVRIRDGRARWRDLELREDEVSA